MRDLIAKLEALDGPSREVDAEIATAVDGYVTQPNKGWPEKIDYGRAHPDGYVIWPGHGFDQLVPKYTASLDAAVALVERVLPGWDWAVSNLGEDGCEGNVWKHGWHDDTVIRGFHNHPTIALLIAALKALEARDG